jgi:hypothetical protein
MGVFVDVAARALIAGETIVAFVDRHSLTEGDEVPVVAAGSASPGDVKPAYRRWIGEPMPNGEWVGVVVSVHPARLLDPESGNSRHVFTTAGEGDLVILRVFDATGRAILSDEAFEARIGSIEGALNR